MAGAVYVVSEQTSAADGDLDEVYSIYNILLWTSWWHIFMQFVDAVEELDEDGDVSTTFGKFR